jgi:hypothetical protein
MTLSRTFLIGILRVAIVMLSVIMIRVVTLIIVMTRAVLLNVVSLSIVMISAITLRSWRYQMSEKNNIENSKLPTTMYLKD